MGVKLRLIDLTGRNGGTRNHRVVLTEEDVLPGACAASLDNLHAVPKSNIGGRIAHLTTRKMKQAAPAASFALGFDAD